MRRKQAPNANSCAPLQLDVFCHSSREIITSRNTKSTRCVVCKLLLILPHSNVGAYSILTSVNFWKLRDLLDSLQPQDKKWFQSSVTGRKGWRAPFVQGPEVSYWGGREHMVSGRGTGWEVEGGLCVSAQANHILGSTQAGVGGMSLGGLGRGHGCLLTAGGCSREPASNSDSVLANNVIWESFPNFLSLNYFVFK